jgi:hypothetical protein
MVYPESGRSALKERPTIMSKRLRIATVAFAMMLAAVGCFAPHAVHSKNPSASTASTPASADTSLQGRWTADAITQAFTAINQKIGANPADYLKVLLTGYNVTVQAINPQKRQNVDEYAYDGTSVKVTPVDVSHSEPGAVEESVFKSDTVKPEILANVIASAVKDSGIEDVTPDVLSVQKNFANDPVPTLDVYVKGPRASKSVNYDLNTGQFQKVS